MCTRYTENILKCLMHFKKVSKVLNFITEIRHKPDCPQHNVVDAKKYSNKICEVRRRSIAVLEPSHLNGCKYALSKPLP